MSLQVPRPQPAASTDPDGVPTTERRGASTTLAAPHAPLDADCARDGLEDLVALAAQLLDASMATVSVAENGYFRVLARHRLDGAPAPDHRLCRAVCAGRPLLVLADAAADPEFCADPAAGRADGVRFYAGIALHGSDGRALGVLGIADRRPRPAVGTDLAATLQRLARLASALIERRALARSCRIAERIAQVDFSAVLVLDGEGVVIFANSAAEAIFGTAGATGRAVESLFPPTLQPDPDAVARWLRAGADAGSEAPADAYELCVERGNDDRRLRTLEAVKCAWNADDDRGSALILRDITNCRHVQQRYERVSTEDALTGLPNRDALLETLGILRRQATPVGVALLGLDNFRAVNDTLGHAIGDTVLQVVASRLLAWLPSDAHLARFGGDEFALIFPAIAADAIELQLHAMLRELARPCEVDCQRVHIEASIGLAVDEAAGVLPGGSDEHCPAASGHAETSELLARAGLAMQHAKRGGGQKIRRFSPDMRADAIDRRRIDLELRRAYRDGEFELHYQPQIDLLSAQPTGAEALLRWRHPERGLLMPAAFMDSLAHSAVALSVGRWILQRACRDAATWPAVDGRRLTVGVNLFPVQFEHERFIDEVDHALAVSGLPAEQLELELTETIALRDDGVAESSLMRLRARGVRVAYDDFGTGHASLSMLHRLPVDRVKIDRSFVRDVIANRGDEAIVRSIALIAQNFDMQVIAEGVETTDQADLLRGIGCQEVQGFLYSTALAPSEFDSWLATRSSTAACAAVAHG